MKEQNKFTEHLHAYTLAHLNSYTHAPLHACTRLRLHALTLTELVIVCAIIAVLVGIVWVVMAPAREKARQAVCISNLTQIGHAFRMYRDDWDGVEPQKGMQLEYWQLGLPPFHPKEKLEPYLNSKQIWICPTYFIVYQYTHFITSTYWVHYCAHEDIVDPYLPPHQYDECPLIAPSINHMASFKWVVSHVPEWPILLCESHHFYYFPSMEWMDEKLLGLHLPDFSVHWFWTSELLTKLPIYRRE